MTLMDTKVMPTNDTNYSCHIKAIEPGAYKRLEAAQRSVKLAFATCTKHC